ncbi:hypothetical protein INT43_002889, partial [Umbelopsis isabellina]
PGEENLTVEERHIYGQLFKAADVDSKGIVLGEEAVEFFKKSGVPPPILSEIWTAADDEQRGFLTQQEFYVALKLIACAQNGQLASEPVLTTTGLLYDQLKDNLAYGKLTLTFIKYHFLVLMMSILNHTTHQPVLLRLQPLK